MCCFVCFWFGVLVVIVFVAMVGCLRAGFVVVDGLLYSGVEWLIVLCTFTRYDMRFLVSLWFL